jgi:DNA repair photolyase
MIKRDAPDLLRRELAAVRWMGEPIVMSGVTDPYQPLERELRITRGCLDVMVECRQPVSIVTKTRLVTRDIDLLHELAAHNAVRVAISLTTLDGSLSRSMEPRASSPTDRLRAIRELAEARIPVTVMTAPIIPGVNDREIPALLESAKDAGASAAGWVMLRLPHQLKDVFLDWLRRELPDRAERVENAIRAMRGGELYNPTWRVRQRGNGPLAEQIGRTFDVFARRLGLAEHHHELNSAAFRRPQPDGQMALFDG